MPTSVRREDAIIKLFVSAYEDNAWKDSCIKWLDKLKDGAVDAHVTRTDGKTLAIEHTLIEPFVGEREDLERFKKSFLHIEYDPSLRQSDRVVYINVPRGALPKGTQWNSIVTCVKRWLQVNLAQLNEGDGYHDCPIKGPGITHPSTMKLHIRIVHAKGLNRGPVIRRYGQTDVGGSVEKALKDKLPKLAKTPADVRILMLERSQFPLIESEIWQEIQRRAADFPRFTKINETWFAETVFYDGPADPNWCGYLGFNRYAGNEALLAASMEFMHGVLISRSRDGIVEVTPESRLILD